MHHPNTLHIPNPTMRCQNRHSLAIYYVLQTNIINKIHTKSIEMVSYTWDKSEVNNCSLSQYFTVVSGFDWVFCRLSGAKSITCQVYCILYSHLRALILILSGTTICCHQATFEADSLISLNKRITCLSRAGRWCRSAMKHCCLPTPG